MLVTKAICMAVNEVYFKYIIIFHLEVSIFLAEGMKIHEGLQVWGWIGAVQCYWLRGFWPIMIYGGKLTHIPYRKGTPSATLDIHWRINTIISYPCCIIINAVCVCFGAESKESAVAKLYSIWQNCFGFIFMSGIQIGPEGESNGVKSHVAHCLFKKTSISFAKHQSREKDLRVFHFSLLMLWCD